MNIKYNANLTKLPNTLLPNLEYNILTNLIKLKCDEAKQKKLLEQKKTSLWLQQYMTKIKKRRKKRQNSYRIATEQAQNLQKSNVIPLPIKPKKYNALYFFPR